MPGIKNNEMEKVEKEMSEIKEFLINFYQGSSEETKKRIKIMLKSDYVDRCKCPKCGTKFNPDEHMKSATMMYPSKDE